MLSTLADLLQQFDVPREASKSFSCFSPSAFGL